MSGLNFDPFSNYVLVLKKQKLINLRLFRVTMRGLLSVIWRFPVCSGIVYKITAALRFSISSSRERSFDN